METYINGVLVKLIKGDITYFALRLPPLVITASPKEQ